MAASGLILLWWLQTPFAASQEQGEGGAEAEAITRFTSITEAAQDIANNWANAPRPRLDAQRRTVHHQQEHHHGQPFASLLGNIAGCMASLTSATLYQCAVGHTFVLPFPSLAMGRKLVPTGGTSLTGIGQVMSQMMMWYADSGLHRPGAYLTRPLDLWTHTLRQCAGSLNSHPSSGTSLKVATSAPPMETSPLVSPPNSHPQLQAAPTAPPSEFPSKKLVRCLPSSAHC